jgi:hypothetical protein
MSFFSAASGMAGFSRMIKDYLADIPPNIHSMSKFLGIVGGIAYISSKLMNIVNR